MNATCHIRSPAIASTTHQTPADSSNCFSRALGVVVDCLCWIWEKVKQFLAMITCNRCFGPTNPAPHTSAPSLDRFKSPLIESMLSCYGMDFEEIHRPLVESAVDRIFSLIAPFAVSHVTCVKKNDQIKNNYINIKSERANELTAALRTIPSLANAIYTEDRPPSNDRLLLFPDEVLICLYHNTDRTHWWDSFRPQQ